MAEWKASRAAVWTMQEEGTVPLPKAGTQSLTPTLRAPDTGLVPLGVLCGADTILRGFTRQSSRQQVTQCQLAAMQTELNRPFAQAQAPRNLGLRSFIDVLLHQHCPRWRRQFSHGPIQQIGQLLALQCNDEITVVSDIIEHVMGRRVQQHQWALLTLTPAQAYIARNSGQPEGYAVLRLKPVSVAPGFNQSLLGQIFRQRRMSRCIWRRTTAENPLTFFRQSRGESRILDLWSRRGDATSLYRVCPRGSLRAHLLYRATIIRHRLKCA